MSVCTAQWKGSASQSQAIEHARRSWGLQWSGLFCNKDPLFPSLEHGCNLDCFHGVSVNANHSNWTAMINLEPTFNFFPFHPDN